MQQEVTNFVDWCATFSTQQACLDELKRHRWPNGFECPRCGHHRAYILTRHFLHQCGKCHHQASVTATTLFEHTKLPLPKWFAAIYLMSSDKGGISAMRLSNMIGVTWRSAQRMLRKLRTAMGDRDEPYRLRGLVEVDDAFIGGKQPGKRGRGAAGKTPILVAVEHRTKGAGFLAMKVIERVNHQQVQQFTKCLQPTATVRSDAYPALNILAQHCEHHAQVTPPQQAGKWLPRVHTVISNLKRFLLGTFHGVSGRYLHEYLCEFVYRFNRRLWQNQLPRRLLNAAANHVAVPIPM